MVKKRTDSKAELTQKIKKAAAGPVKTGSGAVVFNPAEDALSDDTVLPKSNTAKIAKDVTGTISVSAPAEEMQEVSFNDWQKGQESALTSPGAAAQSATDMVKNLVGKSADAAKSVLDELVTSKHVSSFRFVSIGAPMTMDVAPGRVQLVLDAMKRVIDVQIG
jgi:hypothetical protein